jgi:quercetin dioxygenase-like cupin family protein
MAAPTADAWETVMTPAVPTMLADLSSLSYEQKDSGARKALLYRTDEVQVSVYLLEPGGRVPMHRHTASWDISFVIEGEIEARFVEDGEVRTVRCGPQAVNLVPPGLPHEIANASAAKPAKFLLIQSPSHNFDFVRERA